MSQEGGLAVAAEGVVRTYRSRGGESVSALDGVSLDMRPGEFVGLAGRSGSGKTTLLSILGGMDQATSGRVVVGGLDLGAASRAELVRMRRTVGFVFQGAPTIERLPVWENVTALHVALGHGARERRAAAVSALEAVGLARLAERRPEELSTGERHRVALARALACGPRLLLADEPTAGLDRESAERVEEVLLALVGRGTTLLVASHDEGLVARAHRVVRLERGRVV